MYSTFDLWAKVGSVKLCQSQAFFTGSFLIRLSEVTGVQFQTGNLWEFYDTAGESLKFL